MRRIFLTVGIFLVLIFVVFFLVTRQKHFSVKPGRASKENTSAKIISTTDSSTPKTLSELSEKDQNAITTLTAIYAAPVNLYGRVEDEHGKPIAGASVEYSLNDKYFKDGTKGATTSYANGTFAIQGKGASVYVHVQKQGYYVIPDRSEGSIRANQATSPESPVVFLLRVANKPQLLKHNSILTKRVPLGGIPMEVNLFNNKLVASGLGQLRVEAWVDGAQLGQLRNYQWRCRVSVPGGGLVERADPSAFEAPAEGYKPEFEFTMPVLPPKGEPWRDFVEKELYLRLPNQTYARGNLYLSVNPDKALVSFESYWNESGSRNLEAGADGFGRAK